MNKYSFLNDDILDRIVSEAEEERISKKKIFDIYINNMFIENEGSSKNLIDISSGIDFSLLAKNIDVSYKYEGLYNYKTEDILD